MNTPHTSCDQDRLRLMLSDELPHALQADVADHLADCEQCRAQLESLAGDASWWSEVESCFRVRSLSASSTHSSPTIVATQEPADDSYASDFVVDFLEPCDVADALGKLGEYEIVEVIGRGGMGIVLKGFHRELNRYVAVKVMAPHLGTSGAARQRFAREARAAAAIVHPNVMPIHSVCTTTRLPYLVMPYVACESLAERIDRQGALEVKEILRIARQVAAGLAAAHAQGLVHRDVKPANILLEKGVDRVMLTDFGLARAVDDGTLTRTGFLAGTPQYMSPEQAQGDVIDARSDLFSLGSVLYTMATGRAPFRAETTLGVLRRISDMQPHSLREINPDVPAWLAKIVERLHAKLPGERFTSADQVTDLLERCLAHLQQPLTAPLPECLREVEKPKPRFRLSQKQKWIVSASAALATLVLVVVTAWRWNQPALQPPAPAPTVADELTDNSVSGDLDLLDRDLFHLEQSLQSSDWEN